MVGFSPLDPRFISEAATTDHSGIFRMRLYSGGMRRSTKRSASPHQISQHVGDEVDGYGDEIDGPYLRTVSESVLESKRRMGGRHRSGDPRATQGEYEAVLQRVCKHRWKFLTS